MGHEAAELSLTACWCWPDTCFDAAAVVYVMLGPRWGDPWVMCDDVQCKKGCSLLRPAFLTKGTHKNYSIPQLEYGEGKVWLAWLASKIPMTFCREYGSNIGKIVPCSPLRLIACGGAIPSCLSLGRDFKTYCWFQRWGFVKTSNTMVFQDGYPFTNYFDVKMWR